MKKLTGLFLFSLVVLSFTMSSAVAETELEKHVKFFDEDGDGFISASETYNGMRKLGSSVASATKVTFFVNILQGPLSHFSVKVSDIHKMMHKSHTGIYDSDGKFNKDVFNAVFAEFDTDLDEALSEYEIEAMIASNKEDFIGSKASVGEFNDLMRVAGLNREVDGEKIRVLTKETLLEFYTTNFLQKAADQIAQQAAQNIDPKEDL